MSEEHKRYDECDLAENHAKVCRCVVSDEELSKWKSLAGELTKALEAQLESCSYPEKVCSYCEYGSKVIAKAREAGL